MTCKHAFAMSELCTLVKSHKRPPDPVLLACMFAENFDAYTLQHTVLDLKPCAWLQNDELVRFGGKEKSFAVSDSEAASKRSRLDTSVW